MMAIPVTCTDHSHDDIHLVVVPQSSSLPPKDENVCSTYTTVFHTTCIQLLNFTVCICSLYMYISCLFLILGHWRQKDLSRCVRHMNTLCASAFCCNIVIFTYTDHGSVLIPQPCTESSPMVTGAIRAQFGGTIFSLVVEDHCLGENTSVFLVGASTEWSEPVVRRMKIIASHPIGIITRVSIFLYIYQ